LDKKVLLIDFDPQGNLSYSLGLDENLPTIFDVFTGDKEIKDVVINCEGADVIPANMDLADIELSIQSVENRLFVLKEIIDPIKDQYDFIIIDCSPSKSLLTINALVLADKVISTILLDVLSLQGLNQINKTVNDVKNGFNNSLSFLGVLPVNVDLRNNISNEVLDYIKENFDLPLFDTFIRSNVKLIEAPSHGSSIFGYNRNSNGAKDYLSLAKEILINN
jgi:chromosome partitioning protein